jgi:predicted metalloprotease with PDZ domain
VQQSDKLFGARHWRQYDFLLAHQRPSAASAWNTTKVQRERRAQPLLQGLGQGHPRTRAAAARVRACVERQVPPPGDLWTPNYNVPMRNSLLWVYEGMTQYWGHVLATRSGLSTPSRRATAWPRWRPRWMLAAGRRWRNLQDTTNEGTIAARRDKSWCDWQRGADYYDEATLIWLDADTLIREKSGGHARSTTLRAPSSAAPRGAHADGGDQAATYTFDELVATLNGVVPHDWAAFLRQRLDSHGPGAPLDGLHAAAGSWCGRQRE